MNDFKLYLLNHKKILFFFFIGIFIIFIVMYSIYFKDDYDINEEILTIEKIEQNVYSINEYETPSEIVPTFISVDIKGKVKKPGVYQIDSSLDRRIIDVVTMAGGILKDADTSVTNLAKKLFDEMVIIIYSKEEVKEFSKVLESEKIQNQVCQNECDSCVDEEVSNEIKDTTNDNVEKIGLININTASKEELMTLAGIGESKALAIIEYRSKSPFEKIEDIMNISGIKESAFEKIKDYITV